MKPTATYRLQLNTEFDLQDAAQLAPYLKRLGISHIYASPLLQAAPGSTHGYDVVDYSRINAGLGGRAAFDRLVERLRAEGGMGLVLDLVPNHMAISPENPWWWDVLTNGPSSRYAPYFDVDWDPPEARHSNAVLVPVLGDHYGRVLEAGEVQVKFDEGAFTVHYYDHVLPVDPASLGPILSAAAENQPDDQLAFLAGAHDRLPDPGTRDRQSAARRYRDAEVLREMLARLVRERPTARRAIEEVLAAVNSDISALHAFLERQNYRLVFWKLSARELGYRRFFDINTMIGLRMEGQDAYRETHALVLELMRQGSIDGLRIDHPDGLLDPEEYVRQLREDAPQAWIVLEKILEPGEVLPESWPVQGTSGYDFLNQANRVLVDPQGEAPLTAFYAQFTGRDFDYPALVREKKLFAARDLLGPDLGRLTELFLQVCERHIRYRDYTRAELRSTLAEVAAALPVYRTYVRPEAKIVSAQDEEYVREACQTAQQQRPDLDPRLIDFLGDLLLLNAEPWGAVENELVKRFQQFSGPVMAKGVEDTVFYIYNRLVSLNEVGGDPSRFALAPGEFHRAMQEAQARRPLSMLTTSTHDTKRSEDVRARLNVISEMPGAWAEAVQRWAGMNARHRQGDLPDRNAEYLLYQTLVGAWPISADRVAQYLQKASREAKEYTSWTEPNAAYEEALEGFARAILADRRFVTDLETFVAGILEAGRINSLAQVLLKLTAPGVPDLYQGSELWDRSLVDPDNRRPVDYRLRAALMDQLTQNPDPHQVWQHADEGLPKLWAITRALALRGAHPEWFGAESSYTPLEVLASQASAGKSPQEVGLHRAAAIAVTGEDLPDSGGPAIAFLRGPGLLVAVPRLVTRYREQWASFALQIPAGRWRNHLTGETLQGGTIDLQHLFGIFPAALLVREGSDGSI